MKLYRITLDHLITEMVVYVNKLGGMKYSEIVPVILLEEDCDDGMSEIYDELLGQLKDKHEVVELSLETYKVSAKAGDSICSEDLNTNIIIKTMNDVLRGLKHDGEVKNPVEAVVEAISAND